MNGALAHPSCICVANNRKLIVDCLQSLSCRYFMHGSLTIAGDRLQFKTRFPYSCLRSSRHLAILSNLAIPFRLFFAFITFLRSFSFSFILVVNLLLLLLDLPQANNSPFLLFHVLPFAPHSVGSFSESSHSLVYYVYLYICMNL